MIGGAGDEPDFAYGCSTGGEFDIDRLLRINCTQLVLSRIDRDNDRIEIDQAAAGGSNREKIAQLG